MYLINIRKVRWSSLAFNWVLVGTLTHRLHIIIIYRCIYTYLGIYAGHLVRNARESHHTDTYNILQYIAGDYFIANQLIYILGKCDEFLCALYLLYNIVPMICIFVVKTFRVFLQFSICIIYFKNSKTHDQRFIIKYVCQLC